MKYLNNRITGISTLFITALLYIVLTMTVKMPFSNIDYRMWEGYYTLVLEDDAPIVRIIADLELNAKWEIVSEYSSNVQIFNHTGDVNIPVSELKDYYVDGDPLFDPFLQKLPALFKAKSLEENYSLVYIRTEIPSSLFFNKITEIMSDYSYKWSVPEIKKDNQAVGTSIFILSIILLLILNKKLWPFLIPGIVPWFLFASGSGLTGVIVSILFLFGWILLGSQLYNSFRHYLNLGKFDPVDRKKLFVSIFIMTISIFYLFVNSRTLSHIAAYTFALLAHLSSIAFYIIILGYKRRMQQHRIFFPVRIRYKSKNANMLEFAILSLFITIIVISPLIFEGNRSEIDIKLPVPVAIEGISDFSQVSMQILNKHSGQSELPNLSDFISHMIFLETYPYGYQYHFPEPDQILSVPLFSLEEGKVSKKNVSINMFTDRWYESIMTDSSNTGIIKLLLSNNSPTLVGYQADNKSLVTDKFLRNHYTISIFLVLVLIVWLSNLSTSDWYGFKDLVLRRKQQVV